MLTSEIERDVRSFLIDNFLFGRADKLQDNEPLLGGVIDSTGVLELIGFLQDRFEITVEDDDVSSLDSVTNVVAYVREKTAPGSLKSTV